MKLKIEVGTGPLVAPLPFSQEEYAGRLLALRTSMRKAGVVVFVSFPDTDWRPAIIRMVGS